MIFVKYKSCSIASVFKLHGPIFYSLWKLESFQHVQGTVSSLCHHHHIFGITFISLPIFSCCLNFSLVYFLLFCDITNTVIIQNLCMCWSLSLEFTFYNLRNCLSHLFKYNKINELLPFHGYPLFILIQPTNVSQWNSSSA